MKTLVTGAAGFVGSHAVRRLVADGVEVIATDAIPLVDAPRIRSLITEKRITYFEGSLREVAPSIPSDVNEVWHFAANADIPLGSQDTGIDIRESPLLTRTLLDSMRKIGIPSIIFPSSSAVYGDIGSRAREDSGPLLPRSLYGAGKVATESLISAYCYSFGLRARLFRLGNVVGGQMERGIVRDFIIKLSRDPVVLEVLGDGRQRKSYVLVDDVVDAMSFLSARGSNACDVFNVASEGSLSTTEVAFAVARAMGIDPPRIVHSESALSWSGDQPVIELSIDKAMTNGWTPKLDATRAVETAAARILSQPATW